MMVRGFGRIMMLSQCPQVAIGILVMSIVLVNINTREHNNRRMLASIQTTVGPTIGHYITGREENLKDDWS